MPTKRSRDVVLVVLDLLCHYDQKFNVSWLHNALFLQDCDDLICRSTHALMPLSTSRLHATSYNNDIVEIKQKSEEKINLKSRNCNRRNHLRNQLSEQDHVEINWKSENMGNHTRNLEIYS